MIFYHIDRTSNLLPKQKMIEPFHAQDNLLFGSVFDSLSSHGNNYFRYLGVPDLNRDIEITLEYIRAYRYSQYPSRFQSLFASRSLQEALFWTKYHPADRPLNLITIETDKFNFFDCSWITPQDGMLDGLNIKSLCRPFSLGAMCDIADCYWSKKQTKKPIIEVLIPLPCKIIKIDHFDSVSQLYKNFGLF